MTALRREGKVREFFSRLLYVIYNAGDLRDSEQFEKLSGKHEVGGERFRTEIVLP